MGIPQNKLRVLLFQGDIPSLYRRSPIEWRQMEEGCKSTVVGEYLRCLPVTVESVCKNVPKEGAAAPPSLPNASTEDCGAARGGWGEVY